LSMRRFALDCDRLCHLISCLMPPCCPGDFSLFDSTRPLSRNEVSSRVRVLPCVQFTSPVDTAFDRIRALTSSPSDRASEY
jgi:hypothetical protein